MTPDTRESTSVTHLTVKKIRRGMFSAEDGLYLAVFLAVVFLGGILMRIIFRKFFPKTCAKCSHKTDDPDLGQITTSTQVPESHIPSIVVHTCDSGVPVPLTGNPHSYERRRSHQSIAPSMQTVFEEEEEENEVSSSPMCNSDNSVVYTVYTFPEHHSPPVERSKSLTNFSTGLRADQPPSYEDLFPTDSDSSLPENKESTSLKKYFDTRVNIEPQVHRLKN